MARLSSAAPERAGRRLPRPAPGAVVAAGIAALVAGGFAALFSAAGEGSALKELGPYLARVLGFSLAQAAVSTVLSLALGAALALALARRRFPGRSLVLSALGAAAAMPAIVVVFALVAVYGRGGFLQEALRALGFEPSFRIFGWPGILLAHTLLNAPFVARAYLDALAQVPAEHWRLAETLGLDARQTARHIDWPVLRAEFAPLASLVFLLCFTSFAIVLNLGGGGRATLEVAIFEALKTDLDFARAAWLGLVQVALCTTVALTLHRILARPPAALTARLAVPRPDAGHPWLRAFDVGVLALAGLLVLPPLAAVLAGLPHLPRLLDADLAGALATSLVLAVVSALAACLMAVALAESARRPGASAIYSLIPATVLAVPPFALTAGLFLLVRRFADPASAGLVLLPLMNALAALPFAYRFIAPAMTTTAERYGRLASLLGLTGWTRLVLVDGPALRRPLAAAFALAMALSFGDFGIVALFGGSELRTLPYLLYERLGAYRLDEAGGIALLLVVLALALAYASARLTHARH
jgi:thiamine transport system permease protein